MNTHVQPGDTLTLHFAIRIHGGQDIDSSFDDAPITLTLGDGTLEPALESWLIDLPLNERHVFILEPQQAFGMHDAQLVQDVPIDEFHDAPPVVGNLIEFELPDGSHLSGHVAVIHEHDVSIDFNHLLAGKTIEFEVEILTIHPRLP
ncbi:FKBP-type peptidyl-prolyl cis-trans isomerase [Sulfuriferula thiophila]|uniref:FKBP-type peptidyl-prolyl cis-trans isomerase n=1 Tax=Sulfuriferula thiophila TaxID=1781211 RepID=UPI000F605EA1|nr:FKBP-type peptidyl-prolyl cis-trans isomerase [Sulfuriferula thiophila]